MAFRKKTGATEDSALNAEQRLAVLAPPAPILIVAGAGTGKTKTLTSRIIRFIEDGVPPERICAITFTNKAAREMAKRVTSRTAARGFFIGTFHALGARILRSEARAFGRSPSFIIFDEDDALSLARKIAKSLDLKKSDWGAARFLAESSRIKNGMVSLPLKPASRAEILLARFFETYEERLKENNAFDFDDLLAKVVHLFRANAAILQKYRRQFSHIFIDEYQDVNAVQYALVKLLAGNAESVTAVGDDAQMIYGWRGSSIETFLNFATDWPGTNMIFLEENYRSTKQILAAASSVLSGNTYRPAEWRAKKLWTNNRGGAPVRVTQAADAYEEASWIASEIHGAHAERRASGTAILYRTNAQSRALEQALIEADIPYRIVGGITFYERREIRDVITGVRYMENPNDEISRDRLMKTLTKRGFMSFHAACAAQPRTQPTPPAERILFFLAATNYRALLQKNFANAAEREENIAALLEFAGGFERTQDFLERIALLEATDALRETREPSVQLMTIHLAKGLEFDRVYVAGTSEGLIPHARSVGRESELEEERRLLYVAMTRAREALTISFFGLPSRFLTELPDGSYEFWSVSGESLTPLSDEERYISLD